MGDNPAEHLPSHIREALLAELDPGETLRWCGQPNAVRACRMMIPVTIAASLFALGFGSLLIAASRSIWSELHGLEPAIQWLAPGERPTYNAIWWTGGLGGAIVLLGMLALTLPWGAAREARQTVYAITPTRVMSIEAIAPGRAKVEAIEPGHPLHLIRKDCGGGAGDIVLYPRSQGGAMLSFKGVADARSMERLIRATFDPPK